ncbi:MAG: hypothetical protein K1V75_00715 [Muribaculaceae bacterium]
MKIIAASILAGASLVLPLLVTSCGDDLDYDEFYGDHLSPGHLAGKWYCKDADVIDLYADDYYRHIPGYAYDSLKERVEDYLEDEVVYIHPSDIQIRGNRILFVDNGEEWEVLDFDDDDDDLRVVYDTTVYIDSYAIGVRAEVKYERDDD